MDILQALRGHRCQSRLLFTVKLSITSNSERKNRDKNQFKQLLDRSSTEDTRKKTSVLKKVNDTQEDTRNK